MIRIEGVLWSAVLPEIILAFGGIAVLVTGSALKRRHDLAIASISLVVVAAAGFALVPGWDETRAAFDAAVALDGFGSVLKLIFLGSAAATIFASYRFLKTEGYPSIEFQALVLFATAGMMLMATASDLLLVFLALETFSLALYVLVAFRKKRLESQEGALKYFLTGSFSSGFFLYGAALVYGATGSTRFAGIARALDDQPASVRGLALSGLALLIVGLSFKVAAFPFHMWTPDAYQGAPSPVVGFMAAGSKAAGFAVLIRLLVSAFGSLSIDWQPVIIVLATLSMLFGSLVAVAQTNIKRMLAYSAIAHSGFLMIGLVASSDRGISASLFYLAAYAVTIIGAFAVVYVVGDTNEAGTDLSAYRGLWNRNPFLAVVFAVTLVSLAGIPPTAGFWAKFEVFSAALEQGHIPVVIVGVVSSAIAAFFYLRIIVLMFLEGEEAWDEATGPSTTTSSGLVLLGSVFLVGLLGVLPGLLLDVTSRSTFLMP